MRRPALHGSRDRTRSIMRNTAMKLSAKSPRTSGTGPANHGSTSTTTRDSATASALFFGAIVAATTISAADAPRTTSGASNGLKSLLADHRDRLAWLAA